MIFQLLDLMRERRLGDIEQGRGAQQIACFAQGEQGFEMAQFEDGLHYEQNSR